MLALRITVDQGAAGGSANAMIPVVEETTPGRHGSSESE
jgi:hypothetical protein